ncbi:pseudouridine synthase [Propionivibrio sp.]|uniref:16S rRNA pseudouridine(516) synthase n=1 Tax=Propionivibrio sp. TaxID=2212460 RepID=UPI0025E9FE5F|nr:pseudouridine synthase [Propionivibrio sp.]
MSIMQLERLLRSQGFGSRSECRSLICSERVRVGTERCVDPYAEFESDGFQFSVDNTGWTYRKFVYLALNKPANYECSHQPKHHSSVYSLLPDVLRNRRIQAVGRLDADTTGLLLLSDDGQFIHTYTSPRKHIPKVYDVTVKHPLDELQVAALLDGVCLHDSLAPVAAVRCEIRSERLLRMTVTEGRYHLVKRMVAAAGNRVDRLNRQSIGGLALPESLPIGEWTWLETADLARLAQHPQ